VVACSTACLLIPGLFSTASAERAPQPRTVDASVDNYPYDRWRETWAGGEMLARSWSLYAGSTVALTGKIEGPGWRLRSIGGYGEYTYRKWVRTAEGRRDNVRFKGRKTFSDALIGYHAQWDWLTVKAFAGFASEQHLIDPRDRTNDVANFSYGGKVALETWARIGSRSWASVNVSWASTFDTAKAEFAAGYAVLDNLDVGIETRFEGDRSFKAGRIGGLLTWRLGDGGITAGGGVTGDRDGRTSHYARVGGFYRY